jgi:hypothetical protein
MIIVADKNKNKNWNNSKNWNNNKNWNNKKVVVVRPYRPWNKKAYYGTVIGGVALGRGSGLFGSGTSAESLLVLGRSGNDARLLGLLPIG